MSVTENTPAASGADAKAGAPSIDIAMRNATSLRLELQSQYLSSGVWQAGPPPMIEPFSSVLFRAEGYGFAGDVRGYVTFATSAGSEKGPLSISFANPFRGANQFVAVPPAGYAAISTPPQGPNPVVKLTLTTD